MAALLEYIPLVIFFVFYKMFDVFVATGALIVTSILQIIVLKVQKKPILNRQWVFLALIVVFGGMTIFFHNDLFIKWKVTIINAFFGIALLVSEYGFKKNLMKNFLGEQINLPEKVWSKFNLSWACFFFTCAALNLYVAFNFDQETWVNFKVFGLLALTFAFAIGSIMSIYKYMPEDTAEDEEKLKAKEITQEDNHH